LSETAEKTSLPISVRDGRPENAAPFIENRGEMGVPCSPNEQILRQRGNPPITGTSGMQPIPFSEWVSKRQHSF